MGDHTIELVLSKFELLLRDELEKCDDEFNGHVKWIRNAVQKHLAKNRKPPQPPAVGRRKSARIAGKHQPEEPTQALDIPVLSSQVNQTTSVNRQSKLEDYMKSNSKAPDVEKEIDEERRKERFRQSARGASQCRGNVAVVFSPPMTRNRRRQTDMGDIGATQEGDKVYDENKENMVISAPRRSQVRTSTRCKKKGNSFEEETAKFEEEISKQQTLYSPPATRTRRKKKMGEEKSEYVNQVTKEQNVVEDAESSSLEEEKPKPNPRMATRGKTQRRTRGSTKKTEAKNDTKTVEIAPFSPPMTRNRRRKVGEKEEDVATTDEIFADFEIEMKIQEEQTSCEVKTDNVYADSVYSPSMTRRRRRKTVEAENETKSSEKSVPSVKEKRKRSTRRTRKKVSKQGVESDSLDDVIDSEETVVSERTDDILVQQKCDPSEGGEIPLEKDVSIEAEEENSLTEKKEEQLLAVSPEVSLLEKGKHMTNYRSDSLEASIDDILELDIMDEKDSTSVSRNSLVLGVEKEDLGKETYNLQTGDLITANDSENHTNSPSAVGVNEQSLECEEAKVISDVSVVTETSLVDIHVNDEGNAYTEEHRSVEEEGTILIISDEESEENDNMDSSREVKDNDQVETSESSHPEVIILDENTLETSVETKDGNSLTNQGESKEPHLSPVRKREREVTMDTTSYSPDRKKSRSSTEANELQMTSASKRNRNKGEDVVEPDAISPGKRPKNLRTSIQTMVPLPSSSTSTSKWQMRAAGVSQRNVGGLKSLHMAEMARKAEDQRVKEREERRAKVAERKAAMKEQRKVTEKKRVEVEEQRKVDMERRLQKAQERRAALDEAKRTKDPHVRRKDRNVAPSNDGTGQKIQSALSSIKSAISSLLKKKKDAPSTAAAPSVAPKSSVQKSEKEKEALDKKHAHGNKEMEMNSRKIEKVSDKKKGTLHGPREKETENTPLPVQKQSVEVVSKAKQNVKEVKERIREVKENVEVMKEVKQNVGKVKEVKQNVEKVKEVKSNMETVKVVKQNVVKQNVEKRNVEKENLKQSREGGAETKDKLLENPSKKPSLKPLKEVNKNPVPSNPLNKFSALDDSSSGSDESDSDSGGDDDHDPRVPCWARGDVVSEAVVLQDALVGDPDDIFRSSRMAPTCDLVAMFGTPKERYFRRGSSANWTRDHFTHLEEEQYKKEMRRR